MYLEIAGIRKSPQLYSALVLKEIGRFKPFAQWMYTDDLAYSFHADIPMPPPLAIVPLKRLWSGNMTDQGIADDVRQYRPGVILLSNNGVEAPFHGFLESDYLLTYEDADLRLYARKDVIEKARERERFNRIEGK